MFNVSLSALQIFDVVLLVELKKNPEREREREN
jgi:hypothetical protein